ncbi:MAG TPA: hypothetical protein VEY91_05525 [Candidatus Limnocylindria bacterium]|nr:hypothetical protein [Candidatus Limnocylindria bacterium]
MRRFMVNRWWASILALGLTFATASLVVSASWAEETDLIDGSDPFGGGVGDPDTPTGSTLLAGGGRGGMGNRAAGDSVTQGGIRMWHIVIVWQGLKGHLFHF